MPEATAVEGTQVERLQQSVKWFVEERDYFEKASARHYDLLKAAEVRIAELERAVRCAHSSLTWCNTNQQVPSAVWYLEKVLPKAPDPNESAQGVSPEAEKEKCD